MRMLALNEAVKRASGTAFTKERFV